MAGGNKSNSPKAKKRKIQMIEKARSDAAERKHRYGGQGGRPSSGPRG